MKEAKQTRILCYGDSNTWGTIGRWKESDLPSMRFEPDVRWTGVIQKKPGKRFFVLEEGLGGRTTIYANPGEEWKMGESFLKTTLHTHRPLDWIILMLGTNDLQIKQDITADELPLGIGRLVDVVQSCDKIGRDMKLPQVLIQAPPQIRPSDPKGRTEVYAKF